MHINFIIKEYLNKMKITIFGLGHKKILFFINYRYKNFYYINNTILIKENNQVFFF